MIKKPSIKAFARSFSSSHQLMRPLTVDGLNPALLKVQYAVRGELAIKAEVLRDKLKEPNHGLPFDKVISSNIGNPQQKGLDQPPITFTRQVRIIFRTYVLELFTHRSLI
jgi:alanine transaminase